MQPLKNARVRSFGPILLASLFCLLPQLLVYNSAKGETLLSIQRFVALSESEKATDRAIARGYTIAIHDLLWHRPNLQNGLCFETPTGATEEEIFAATSVTVSTFLKNFSKHPSYSGQPYPARDIVHRGLAEHFPCNM